MPPTFTNPPSPQPPTGSCTYCQFFFMPPAQSESENKWLLAFKVATLLILFLTLIRCLSKRLSKFGNICCGGQALSGGSSPGTNNICSGGQALSGSSNSPGTNNICGGGSSPGTKITNEVNLSVNDSITM